MRLRALQARLFPLRLGAELWPLGRKARLDRLSAPEFSLLDWWVPVLIQ